MNEPSIFRASTGNVRSACGNDPCEVVDVRQQAGCVQAGHDLCAAAGRT
jgi:hypothetical protein